MNKWLLRQSVSDYKELANEIGISEIIAKILINRKITTKNEIESFIRPTEKEMGEAGTLKDIKKGIDIITEAIENEEKIVVYGDYDVDGIISTYILFHALRELGANVIYHLPDREEEGYGLNSNRIRLLKSENNVDVIITCDNGIAAIEEVKLAKELGMKIVVTDHHDIPFSLENGKTVYNIPNADAIINPKQEGCEYPFKQLCGAGVAFKFINELFKYYEVEEEAFKYIEFVAIATVCDVMDLVGENRYIVKEGLKLINKTENIGLRSLMEMCSISDKEIEGYHLGFVIGPCLNATGRLENAKIAVDMFLCEDVDEAKIRATNLYELNKERQQLTIEATKQVNEMIKENNYEKDIVKIIYNPNIHESIAGIVAGRIKETYYSPTIILTKGKESLKGSARSIEGYDIFEELTKCKELLGRFGGHPMAAGLSIEEENVNKLRDMMNANCRLSEDDICQKIRIDIALSPEIIDENLIDELNILKPFGKGNESPVFATKNANVYKIFYMGTEKTHLKFSMKIGNKTIQGLFFNGRDEFIKSLEQKYNKTEIERIIKTGSINEKFDFVYYPNINEYNGVRSIQLNIKDIRLSK